MIIKLTNYRCFPNGATLDLSNYFTALVGVNNAGKSSLLRFAYEFRPLWQAILESRDWLVHAIHGASGSQLNVPDVAEVFSKMSQGDLVLEVDLSPAVPLSNPYSASVAKVPDRMILTLSRQTQNWTVKFAIGPSVLQFQPPPAELSYSGGLIGSAKSDMAFIGPLLEGVSSLSKSVYIPSFRNTINAGGSNFYDIDVGQKFIQTYREWSTGDQVTTRDAALELQRIIRSMFGYAEFTITPNSNATSLVCTIDGRSYSLSEQGSGLAQFVLVLANVAVKRPPCVFIDEPELNLHPSLQRDFLIALAEFSGKVVFATHSLGLALSDADRVYSVCKVSQGVSEVHEYGQTPRLSEFLGELSYAGYKELGFESILLVEGPTEVKVFRHFLQLYGKSQKVVPVQMGGSNMINGKRKDELAELFHICPKIAAVVDSDRTAAGMPAKNAVLAFETVCQQLGISSLVLDRFATENYLTDAAVKTELGAAKNALGLYQKIDKATYWDKDINWKIARHMTKADLDGTDLGAFLAGL